MGSIKKVLRGRSKIVKKKKRKRGASGGGAPREVSPLYFPAQCKQRCAGWRLRFYVHFLVWRFL